MIKWVVIWKAYGEWKCTVKIFDTDKQAAEHSKMLAEKDYNTGITVTPIRVPE